MMNFTYCPVHSGITEAEVEQFLAEVRSVPDEHWHFDEFRNCQMLAFYNQQDGIGEYKLEFVGDKEFSSAAIQYCPNLIAYIRKHVMSWMKPHGRVTVLRTPPQTMMAEHIDCSPKEVGTIQHKWRLVLHGEIDGLYFINEKMEHVHVDPTQRCYVLDGGHPHCIDPSSVEKITVCIGSPWLDQTDDPVYAEQLMLDKALYLDKPTIRPEWVRKNIRKKD